MSRVLDLFQIYFIDFHFTHYFQLQRLYWSFEHFQKNTVASIQGKKTLQHYNKSNKTLYYKYVWDEKNIMYTFEIIFFPFTRYKYITYK